jgi:NADP-dependent 3-hydroxy acid dehydrogenase YdfG
MSDLGEAQPDLGDTVALVTGASSGIGEATALALAARGSTVAVAARRGDRLDDLISRITADGGRAVRLEADITDPERAAEVVAQTVEQAGRLDIVVNNAGVMLLGPAMDAPLEEWDRMVDLNVKALLHVTKAALPHLVAAAADGPRRVADLVNISSVAGRRTRSGSAVYNLTKFGVGAVSESLREEFAPQHVRVSVVEPGATMTELATHLRPEVMAATRQRFANLEMLQAADIADAVTYIVTRPRHVAINEVLIRPTEQAG